MMAASLDPGCFMATTLYWHDYETFGVDPRRDRPVQFAGLRTDEDLNVLGDPLVIYCQPALDVLPHPEACLLTGITPQLAFEKGVCEAEFIARIHDELAKPGTCALGYNTLRFDDEVTRHTLYRNFFDPYAREWQHGNSRWDLIDLARMTCALRPEGIEWPQHEDGRPSFRLEDLAGANGIGHEAAHDALSDVHATIGLARLIREKQPRLYDWLFQLRNKRKAREQLDLIRHTPVVHSSSMYPSETACTTLAMPLVQETGNSNSFLLYDLRVDPREFLALSEEQLRERLFTRAQDLPDGVQRLPVKSVKINKCPALAPLKTLDAAAVTRIAIDLESCEAHGETLRANTGFMQRVAQAYAGQEYPSDGDVDAALYDGFINDSDRALMEDIRHATPEQLGQATFNFQDRRLPTLLFRYRARNWPDSLSAEEAVRWENFRRHRLLDTDGGGTITLEQYAQRVVALRSECEGDQKALRILDALETWGRGLFAGSG